MSPGNPSPPPFWNLRARYRVSSRADQVKAQIAVVTAVAIALIVLMAVVTLVVVFRLMR